MLNARKVKNDTKNIYELYIQGRWCDAEKKVRCIMNEIDELKSNISYLKNAASHIGVLTVLLENEKILSEFLGYLDENSDEYDFIITELHMLDIFDNIVGKNMFSTEQKIVFFETIIDRTAKNNKFLYASLVAMCNVHLIKEEYYDLSDVLRRVSFHLASEENEEMIIRLEGILKRFMPVVKEEDPCGFYEIMDILNELYPAESLGIDA